MEKDLLSSPCKNNRQHQDTQKDTQSFKGLLLGSIEPHTHGIGGIKSNKGLELDKEVVHDCLRCIVMHKKQGIQYIKKHYTHNQKQTFIPLVILIGQQIQHAQESQQECNEFIGALEP